MHGFIEASEQLRLYALGCIKHQYSLGSKTSRPYHNTEHTNSAIHSAKLLAEAVQLPQRDSLLLSIAAAFHDYVHNGDSDPNNELRSADVVDKKMREHQIFTDSDIERVKQMILATNCTAKYPKIVQSPRENDICSMILCDADLSSFGKPYDEFIKSADYYFEELYPHSNKNSDLYSKYLKAEIVILRNHEFWTNQASDLFPHRLQNIQRLEELIKKC